MCFLILYTVLYVYVPGMHADELNGLMGFVTGSRRMRFASGNVFQCLSLSFIDAHIASEYWIQGDGQKEMNIISNLSMTSSMVLGISCELVPLEAVGWNRYISCTCHGL